MDQNSTTEATTSTTTTATNITTTVQLVEDDDKELPSHGIYWSEQNDDILLQNLFANTLLSDEFSKKTDFDLSFDTLQLNLDDSAATNNNNTTSNGEQGNQQSTLSSTVTNNGRELTEERPQSSDDTLLMLNQSAPPPPPSSLQPVILELVETGNSSSTSELEKHQIILADTLSMTLNLNQLPPVSENDSTIASNNTDLLSESQQQRDTATTDDDKLFKKPEFITLTNLNLFESSDFVINLNSLDSSGGGGSAADRATAKKSIALLQSKLKESATSANNKLKKIRKRSKLVNSGGVVNPAGAGATSNSQDTANCSASGKKELKLVKLKQSRLAAANSNSSSSTHTLSSSSSSTMMIINKGDSNKHTNKVARSRLQDAKANKNGGVEPLSKKFAGSFVNSPQQQITSSTTTTTINNGGSFINTIGTSNGFGFNNSSDSGTNDLNNDKNIIILKSLKKDEVDLHIKELSLLDLHSSEDDSAAATTATITDMNSKNNRGNGIKMRKNMPPPSYRANIMLNHVTNNQTWSLSGGGGAVSGSSNQSSSSSNTILSNSSSFLSSSSSSTSSLAINNSTIDQSSTSGVACGVGLGSSSSSSMASLGNSELISKRIKYSPVSSSFSNNTSNSQLLLLRQQSNSTAGHLVNVPETSSTTVLEDPAVKYLSKSLDSNETPSSSTTTSTTLRNDSSGILSPLSPPSTACKKKRKKKDNGTEKSSSPPCDQHPSLANQSITLVNQTQYPANNSSHQFQSSSSSGSTNNSNLFNPGAIENDTLQHMKNLDLNNDLTASTPSSSSTTTSFVNGSESSSKLLTTPSSNLTVNLDLNDINSRNYLWNLLKAHSTHEELVSQFGSVLHDKITFWDLAQLKLKYAKSNQLKTTYQIIDDYTVLYSNMRTYMEKVVNEQSSSSSLLAMSNSNLGGMMINNNGSSSRKSDNSSRSRSSSRNPRKQSTSSVNR